MKAMRRRIALQLRKLSRVQHFVRNLTEDLSSFALASEVRTRARGALVQVCNF
jgi:hypothetical protein